MKLLEFRSRNPFFAQTGYKEDIVRKLEYEIRKHNKIAEAFLTARQVIENGMKQEGVPKKK